MKAIKIAKIFFLNQEILFFIIRKMDMILCKIIYGYTFCHIKNVYIMLQCTFFYYYYFLEKKKRKEKKRNELVFFLYTKCSILAHYIIVICHIYLSLFYT
jgi:hypothetical protein